MDHRRTPVLPTARQAVLLVACLGCLTFFGRAAVGTEPLLEKRLSHRARVKLEFSHRESDHPVRLVLTPELQALARPDLGDLRLLATAPGQQPQPIPFRLALPRDRELAEEYATESKTLPPSPTGSRWAVSAGDPPPPVNSLVLQLDDSHRNRRYPVVVWGGDSVEGTDWTLLTDHGLWLDISQPGRRKTISRISFPPARHRWYRVELAGAPDAPPPIQTMRLLHLTDERAPHHEFPAPIHTTTRNPETGVLTITCAVPHAGLPLQAVHLEIPSATDYLLTARVSVSASPDQPGVTIGTGEIHQLSAGGPPQIESSVKCAGTTQSWLHVVLETEPGTSLEVTEVTTIVSERGVVFDPEDLPTRPDEHLALYLGNAELASPDGNQPPLDRPAEWVSLPAVHVDLPVPNPAYQQTALSTPDQPAGPQPVDSRVVWLLGATLGLATWGALRFFLRRPPQNRSAADRLH